MIQTIESSEKRVLRMTLLEAYHLLPQYCRVRRPFATLTMLFSQFYVRCPFTAWWTEGGPRLARWFSGSVLKLAGSTSVRSDPVCGTTSQQPTPLSTLPRLVSECSEVSLRAQSGNDAGLFQLNSCPLIQLVLASQTKRDEKRSAHQGTSNPDCLHSRCILTSMPTDVSE